MTIPPCRTRTQPVPNFTQAPIPVRTHFVTGKTRVSGHPLRSPHTCEHVPPGCSLPRPGLLPHPPPLTGWEGVVTPDVSKSVVDDLRRLGRSGWKFRRLKPRESHELQFRRHESIFVFGIGIGTTTTVIQIEGFRSDVDGVLQRFRSHLKGLVKVKTVEVKT